MQMAFLWAGPGSIFTLTGIEAALLWCRYVMVWERIVGTERHDLNAQHPVVL